MALKTQGFALSALPRAPQIPGNVGVVNVKEIYDGVRRGLESAELARSALGNAGLVDAQTQAATQQAPLGTRRALAQTEASEEQLPLQTRQLANKVANEEIRAPLENAILTDEASPAYRQAKLQHLLQSLVPSGTREFNLFTAGLSPEDKALATRIHLGLDARKSGAALVYKTVTGSDGVQQVMALDPREVGAQVIGSGEKFGSGVVTPGAATAAPVAAVPVAAVGDVDENGTPIEGTAAVPVATTTAVQGAITTQGAANPFRSQTPQEKKAAETTGAKTVEMQLEGRAKLPKALSSLEGLESTTKRVESDIDEASRLAGPLTTGAGSYLKVLPATDARKLEALLTSIRANIGFNALSDMRASSPTGGALGNVSDYEGKQLQSTIAALDQALASGDLKEALTKVKEARREALVRTRNAFERDASFFGLPPAELSRAGVTTAPATTQPGAPSASRFKIVEIK